MKITFFNSNLENIDAVDILNSFLWVDRYDEQGDFELASIPTNDVLANLAATAYVGIEKSDHLMMVDDLKIHTDLVNGNDIFLKGPSLETILKWRSVIEHTVLTGNFQDAILQLLNENAINPTDTDRKITRLEFVASTDPTITALTIDNQFLGQTLYDIISSLCKINGIGFKITLSDLNKFQFKLYSGVDRSYGQSVNPWVVFSPDFDNLVNADYSINSSSLKTVVFVAGEEGVGNIRPIIVVSGSNGARADLARREVFFDAKDVTRNGPDGTLTDPEYYDQLAQKGLEVLVQSRTVTSFEGQLETDTNIYTLGVDFDMGDILQVANEYGHEAESRVVEIIYFQDGNGERIFPTFASVSN